MPTIMSLDKEFLKHLTGRDLETAAFYNVYEKISKAKSDLRPHKKALELIDAIAEASRNKPTLAGGSIVRYMIGKGEWQSDFDFWHDNADDKEAFRKKMQDYEDSSAANIHSQTYSFPLNNRKLKIQSINTEAATVPDLVKDFDFTICQFAYLGDGRVYCTNVALADLINRRLRFTGVIKNPAYTKARMLKYMQLGFKPDADMVKWLVDDSIPISEIGSIVY